MNGGDDCSGVDRGGCPAVTPVPVGWQRRVEEGGVRYISPSGTSLASLEQTRAYLLADGTCKCGLECPLNVHKVFNFDPTAMVMGSEGTKGDEDMTKLCNHRRKIVAMATLYRSMESHGPLSLPHLGPGTGLNHPSHPTMPGPSSRPQQTLPTKAKGPELYSQCPSDRYGNAWSSQSSSFPRHHNALFGDVFPSCLPAAATNGNSRPSFPSELNATGGSFLHNKPLSDAPPRPYPSSGLLFPPSDEVVPGQEGGGPWSSRLVVPLGSQACTVASPAPTSLSVVSSPAGSAEPSPQRSRHSSASSEQGLCGHRPASKPLDATPLANALTNQSSNNLPSVPLGVAPDGKGPPGLLLLHSQGPGSFPASSLLSAAAKAQLASRGRPDELAASTLPSRLLLSVVGGRAPRRQRRSPTVLRLLKDSHSGQAGVTHPEETLTRHPRPRDQPPVGEAKNGPPNSTVPAQPLSSLFTLLGPPVSSPMPGLPPLAQTPAGDSPNSLPSFQDFNSQLLSLFGQLASASSEQISGSPPQPQPPVSPLGSRGATGAASASPMTPKAPPTPSPVAVATSTMESGGLGCPLPSGTDPFPFLAQEQALSFGNALPPGLLPLGSFPFSLTLGPETPIPQLSLQGEPEGQPLLPLVLPSLDLLQQPSGLLASLLALPEATCEGEREATTTTEPLLEPFAGLPETLQPLLFPALSTSPAVLALNSALLATSLGPSDTGPGPMPTGLASTPVAPTSTSMTSTTTEGTPSASGRLNPLMPPLVNPLLSTTLLGDLSALNPASAPSLIGSPLLQAQQPLLPPNLQGPLGLQLFQGQLPLLTGSNPMACLLQSLQLSPGFGTPEKPVMPNEALGPALSTLAPVLETEPSHSVVLPSCVDTASPSALEPPNAPEPPRQGQHEASSSRSPFKRPRRGTEELNGDSGSSLPRGPGRGGKSGRRGSGRGRGRRHFNGQLPELGTSHPSHPTWRCNGEMVVSSAESQASPFAVQEIKGPPGRRPARRGRRRKSSGARPSSRPEATRIRGASAEPGPSPVVDYAVARRPRPGRPVKNRRRKLPT